MKLVAMGNGSMECGTTITRRWGNDEVEFMIMNVDNPGTGRDMYFYAAKITAIRLDWFQDESND